MMSPLMMAGTVIADFQTEEHTMSKKHFIALADAIREHNRGVQDSIDADEAQMFGPEQLDTLAEFCQSQNPQFKRDRWLAYIAGECGKNGGAVKQAGTR